MDTIVAVRPTMRPVSYGKVVLALAVIAASLVAGGCAGSRTRVPTDISQADKYLYDKGQESLAEKKWLRAREYFRQLYDGYPQSVYRPEAKIGLGDAYLGDGSPEALVLAQNEFSEFLTFYPTNRRADYAQYRLAMTHFQQMRSPDRDQSQTREAVAEFEMFLSRYPNSALMSTARQKYREARDRLSDSEYRVGLFYHRVRWYPGSIERLRGVIDSDPEFTNRDAVYFYLGENFVKIERPAEALPYFDRLLKEFTASEFLDRAKVRVEELKASLSGLEAAKKVGGQSIGGIDRGALASSRPRLNFR